MNDFLDTLAEIFNVQPVINVIKKIEESYPVDTKVKHYKGGEYTITGYALNQSDDPALDNMPTVIYQNKDGLLFTRNFINFFGDTWITNEMMGPRFTKLEK